MKAALIGLGMVSKTYADAIAGSDVVTLGPVFARTPKSRTDFLATHTELGARAADSLEDIADDESVDFAILTTPPDARAEIVETLARAGMPILMEKPVERTLPAAKRIVETCERAGVALVIMLQHRARPVAEDLAARMQSLGPLVAVEVNVPWWRPQAYYDEPGRGSYARDGGGVLISQAIHTLDLMLTLTGPVADVTAMCVTTAHHRMEAEDFVVAGLRFANGAAGQLFATTAGFPGAGETSTLHCRDASARLGAGVLKIDWLDGRSESSGESMASGAGADPMAFTSDWHRLVIEDFAEAVSAGRPPLVPGRSALAVHALIEAIERSGRTGGRVEVEGQ